MTLIRLTLGGTSWIYACDTPNHVKRDGLWSARDVKPRLESARAVRTRYQSAAHMKNRNMMNWQINTNTIKIIEVKRHAFIYIYEYASK